MLHLARTLSARQFFFRGSAGLGKQSVANWYEVRCVMAGLRYVGEGIATEWAYKAGEQQSIKQEWAEQGTGFW